MFWRREAKEIPFKDWLKENNIYKYKTYIGYTFREVNRWKNIEQYNSIAPLVEWKWNEPDVQAYLKENMMENKLYQHFSRTGCGICQKQSLEAKYQLYKHYPKQWDFMADIEARLSRERE